MGIEYNTKSIVKEGLKLYLDVENIKSVNVGIGDTNAYSISDGYSKDFTQSWSIGDLGGIAGGGISVDGSPNSYILASSTEQNVWTGITWGDHIGGVFVAVAESGTNRVMASSNGGNTWVAASTPEQNTWQSVTYGPKHNVAPTSWTAVAATSQIYWHDITYGNGKFVAVSGTSTGGNDQVMYSTDGGKTWTSTAAAADRTWRGITYGDGKFVAVAGGGGTGDMVMYSTDGINWTTAQATGDIDWRAVTYGDGKFVAVAANGITPIMYSTDGISWTGANNPPTNIWYDVTYGNGKFVAVATNSTNRVTYSTDGINWTSTPAIFDTVMWDSIAYCENCDNGNGRFVASAITGSNRFMNSTDGISWFPAGAHLLDNNQWEQITYGGGYFVAVAYDGTNRIVYAVEGENDWNIIAAPEQNGWLGVAYGEGRFVAVAGNGTNRVMYSNIVDVPNRYVGISSGGTNRVMYSNDGLSWTAASAAEQNEWYSITYGDGKFVAVSFDGTNRVMYSSDAITWTAASAAEQNEWFMVSYGGGKFVAVSPTGTNRVMYSSDGINWTSASAAAQEDWYGLAYGNGTWVSTAWIGTTNTDLIMYSTDGINWSNNNINYTIHNPSGGATNHAGSAPSADWGAVTYGNGYFVSVCDYSDNPALGMLMYSTDGISWTLVKTKEQNSWYQIAYGEGRFISVSNDGTNRILRSRDVRDKTTQLIFGAQSSTDYIHGQMNDNYQLSNNAMTISVWAKYELSNPNIQTIVSKSSVSLIPPYPKDGFRLKLSSYAVYFEIGDTLLQSNISTKKWNYITVTCSLNSTKIYVNGVEVAYSNNLISLSVMPSSNSDWDLGGSQVGGGTDESFKGSLAMFKVYNKELTVLEIKQNFDAFKTRYGY